MQSSSSLSAASGEFRPAREIHPATATTARHRTQHRQQQQQKPRPKGPPPRRGGKKGRGQRRRQRHNNHDKANSAKWWRSSTEVDPITLEQIKDLPIPPFALPGASNLSSSSSSSSPPKQHLFDADSLAEYITSTANFSHPMTRRSLTLDDCLALDAHLALHGRPHKGVADAFRLQASVSIGRAGHRNGGRNSTAAAAATGSARRSNGDDARRREAVAVMHSMFSFPRHGENHVSRGSRSASPSPPPPPPARQQAPLPRYLRVAEHDDGGLRVFDDDEWEAMPGTLDDEAPDGDGAANMNRAFPALVPARSEASSGTASAAARAAVQEAARFGAGEILGRGGDAGAAADRVDKETYGWLNRIAAQRQTDAMNRQIRAFETMEEEEEKQRREAVVAAHHEEEGEEDEEALAEVEEWTCDACTFRNDAVALSCRVCFSRRPPMALRAAREGTDDNNNNDDDDDDENAHEAVAPSQAAETTTVVAGRRHRQKKSGAAVPGPSLDLIPGVDPATLQHHMMLRDVPVDPAWLCPYDDTTLRWARSRATWVGTLEARLAELTLPRRRGEGEGEGEGGEPRVLTPALGPMKAKQRLVVHFVCEHFGLRHVSRGKEPQRYVEISRTPLAAVPILSLSRAARQLPHLANVGSINAGARRGRGRRTSGGSGGGTIHLGAIRCANMGLGPGKKKKSRSIDQELRRRVGRLTKALGLRRGEWHATWLRARPCFSSKKKYRKRRGQVPQNSTNWARVGDVDAPEEELNNGETLQEEEVGATATTAAENNNEERHVLLLFGDKGLARKSLLRLRRLATAPLPKERIATGGTDGGGETVLEGGEGAAAAAAAVNDSGRREPQGGGRDGSSHDPGENVLSEEVRGDDGAHQTESVSPVTSGSDDDDDGFATAEDTEEGMNNDIGDLADMGKGHMAPDLAAAESQAASEVEAAAKSALRRFDALSTLDTMTAAKKGSGERVPGPLLPDRQRHEAGTGVPVPPPPLPPPPPPSYSEAVHMRPSSTSPSFAAMSPTAQGWEEHAAGQAHEGGDRGDDGGGNDEQPRFVRPVPRFRAQPQPQPQPQPLPQPSRENHKLIIGLLAQILAAKPELQPLEHARELVRILEAREFEANAEAKVEDATVPAVHNEEQLHRMASRIQFFVRDRRSRRPSFRRRAAAAAAAAGPMPEPVGTGRQGGADGTSTGAFTPPAQAETEAVVRQPGTVVRRDAALLLQCLARQCSARRALAARRGSISGDAEGGGDSDSVDGDVEAAAMTLQRLVRRRAARASAPSSGRPALREIPVSTTPPMHHFCGLEFFAQWWPDGAGAERWAKLQLRLRESATVAGRGRNNKNAKTRPRKFKKTAPMFRPSLDVEAPALQIQVDDSGNVVSTTDDILRDIGSSSGGGGGEGGGDDLLGGQLEQLDAPATLPSVFARPREDPPVVEQFGIEIQQLRAMGFDSDESVLRNALFFSGGVLADAVGMLIATQ